MAYRVGGYELFSKGSVSRAKPKVRVNWAEADGEAARNQYLAAASRSPASAVLHLTVVLCKAYERFVGVRHLPIVARGPLLNDVF